MNLSVQNLESDTNATSVVVFFNNYTLCSSVWTDESVKFRLFQPFGFRQRLSEDSEFDSTCCRAFSYTFSTHHTLCRVYCSICFLDRYSLGLHRAQLAASTAGQTFCTVFLKFERADYVQPAEKQAAGTEATPETNDERGGYNKQKYKNPAGIESYPEMQDKIKNKKEIFENTD